MQTAAVSCEPEQRRRKVYHIESHDAAERGEAVRKPRHVWGHILLLEMLVSLEMLDLLEVK